MSSIYLDHAAATPLDERVFAAMQPYLLEHFYNPSAAYQAARGVKSELADARHRLAMCIGAKPSEIIMTAGATESINIAIHGVIREYGGTIVTTAVEHPAVLASTAHYESTSVVPADIRGYVSAEDIATAIDDQTTLVSVGYANNELGTIQSLRAIADAVQAERDRRRVGNNTRPIYFHTDASQAAGLLDLSVARLGVDLMTLNAGKCYGPKQVGLLWASSDIRLAPFIDGGGQERGIRAGTENVAGVIGFAEALTRVNDRRKSESQRLGNLRDSLQKRLETAFDDVVINGYKKRRLPNHLHLSLPGLDGERALFALDERGVMVATGSACAANKGTRSHVLTAIGMAPELADGSIRITLGHSSDEASMKRAAEIIIDVMKTERNK